MPSHCAFIVVLILWCFLLSELLNKGFLFSLEIFASPSSTTIGLFRGEQWRWREVPLCLPICQGEGQMAGAVRGQHWFRSHHKTIVGKHSRYHRIDHRRVFDTCHLVPWRVGWPQVNVQCQRNCWCLHLRRAQLTENVKKQQTLPVRPVASKHTFLRQVSCSAVNDSSLGRKTSAMSVTHFREPAVMLVLWECRGNL